MSIRQELIEYARNCLDDIYIDEYEDYISCQKHKWACQRLLDDFKKLESPNVLVESFPYYWDEEEAEKIVKWFGYLRHSKGVLAGKPIELTLWQKFCLCQIYGWRHKETGYKRFSKSFIEVARKNAKSQMEAGVILYEIATQSTKHGEIYESYCAGVKRKQSKIIFDECKNLLKKSPLSTKFKITRDRITHIKTESFLEPLCKEDGKNGDGTNPAVLVIDEYHQHPTTEFYDLGYGANTKESLLMIITTAGVDLTYPCFTQEYNYCSNLLNPDVDVFNDDYFVDILELEKKDKIENTRNWWKANPIRMTYAEGVKKIKNAYKVAKDIPEKLPAFKTKCLNIWVQAKDSNYMDMAKWKKCQVEKIPFNLENRDVFVGVDVSAKIDLTSVAFILPIMDDSITKYVVFSHSFIPNYDKLRERIKKDKQPYDAWEEQKHLTVQEEDIVDQQQVIEYIIAYCELNNWNIKLIAFDPANSSKMMLDMGNMGYTVVEAYQSHKSLNEGTVDFREQVYKGNVLYTYNPLLNFAMANSVIKQNNGLIKIDKDKTIKRIDPVDALLCAYKYAMYYEFEPEPIDYSDEYLDSLGW